MFSLLLGYGNGSFMLRMIYAVDEGPYAIVSEDFNKDNKLDLAVGNDKKDSISI